MEDIYTEALELSKALEGKLKEIEQAVYKQTQKEYISDLKAMGLKIGDKAIFKDSMSEEEFEVCDLPNLTIKTLKPIEDLMYEIYGKYKGKVYVSCYFDGSLYYRWLYFVKK